MTPGLTLSPYLHASHYGANVYGTVTAVDYLCSNLELASPVELLALAEGLMAGLQRVHHEMHARQAVGPQ